MPVSRRRTTLCLAPPTLAPLLPTFGEKGGVPWGSATRSAPSRSALFPELSLVRYRPLAGSGEDGSLTERSAPPRALPRDEARPTTERFSAGPADRFAKILKS
jgi:hypothetical protein